MALEDFVDPEVGIAVAATALLASPKARNVARRGLVYGLAGLMRLGDTASAAARGVAGSAQQAAGSVGNAVQEASTEAQTPRRTRRTTETKE
ncbi:MAG: hypothetical protein M3Z66_08625 [Chloroflexota bacterium]|nr:hypothetical protein [Chloroflexota bacterium]